MLILGIETATPTCAVALWRDGRLLGETRVKIGRAHSEILAELIERLLAAARCGMENLTGVAVSKGPGSFTGLRIGMAMAKAVALARSIPIVGVPTPDAIASSIVPAEDRLIVTLASRRGEVYAAPYRHLDGEYHREGKIVALTVAEFAQWKPRGACVAGPGIETLRAAGVAAKCYLPENYWEIGAAAVARLGARRLLAGEEDDLDRLEPEYVKPFFTTARPRAVRQAG